MAEVDYVFKNEVKEYKKEMIEALIEVSKSLKKKGKKGFCYSLVGSSKRNLVLRKGNSLYDVDIQIITMGNGVTPKYREDILEELKQQLSCDWCFEQSTSVITARIPDQKSFDLALIWMVEGDKKISVLVKNNEGDKFIWNEVKNSNKHNKRLKKIKGLDWDDVREEYKKLRSNQWDLSKSDKKPSYALYVETINNVYNNKQ